MFNFLLAENVYDMIMQYFISFVFIKFLSFIPINPKAQWFFIHAIFNFFIALFALPDVYTCFFKINECVNNNYSWQSTLPITLTVVLHIFHCVAFSNLKFADYFHHFIMVPPSLLFSLIFKPVPGLNLALFTITGFPGMIDYILLTLVKCNKIDPIIEKRANIYIQTWLRMPLTVYTTTLVFSSYMQGFITLLPFIGSFLISWNGIYYMHDTTKNFYSKGLTT